MESSMSKAGLDNRHRNKDGEISHKHGNTLIRTLRKIYGQGFAAGYPEIEKLSGVLLQLNETSITPPRSRPVTWSAKSPTRRSNAAKWRKPTFDASFAVAGIGRNSIATRLFDCGERRNKSCPR
jgi:hypothetical protein